MKVKCTNKGYGLSLLALSALTVSALHADYGSNYKNNHDQRKGHNQSMNSKQCDKRVITPAAGPRVTNGADLFVSADFIYWRMSQGGTDFAYTGSQSFTNVFSAGDTDPSYADAPQGQISSVANDWAPGFKAGIGLDTSMDGWDVYAEYTWVHFRNTATVSKTPFLNTGDVSVSQVGIPLETNAVYRDRSEAKFSLQYNKVNLELGRNFYFSQYLTARPHTGVTGAWLNDTFRVSATGNAGTDTLTNISWGDPEATATVDGADVFNGVTKNWGVGARIGLDLGWHFNKEWSIYSSFAGNAIWNKYTTNSFTGAIQGHVSALTGATTDVVVGDPVNKTVTNMNTFNGSAVNYIVETELGICWESFFYDDNYHFAAKLGWELQNWINYMKVTRVQGFSNHDLALHGLNVQLRFDF
ncbi:hypothetical protein COB21_02550 [Candidatus Aerophobetes bacterium]|uniref:MOMP-like family protein n=1 Tax=Aerophobetes bacterium TaxID=2030807 RepID=A0A2A4X5A7_UNCAE|nr:MAG: hypothetical protein COB21_02550 [Candidatus Aerophobetes bacterium]